MILKYGRGRVHSKSSCCAKKKNMTQYKDCSCSVPVMFDSFTTPGTAAQRAPLSTGFSRQEYWNGLPCPPPGNLPNPRIQPASLRPPALAGRFSATSTAWEVHPHSILYNCVWTGNTWLNRPILGLNPGEKWNRSVNLLHVKGNPAVQILRQS